ncbi:hypothetical protein A33M_2903 [Rhodovulum sp. PH10]|nr:hypothetical protein [Rhodovulum sp. PH10]EJW11706.1 hypothetical protein A33M_2903 [Rhodovulum sp. PH10]
MLEPFLAVAVFAALVSAVAGFAVGRAVALSPQNLGVRRATP